MKNLFRIQTYNLVYLSLKNNATAVIVNFLILVIGDHLKLSIVRLSLITINN